MKALVQLGLRLYFNKIEIIGRGNIPTDKHPIIFAPNHQGAFLDALIVGAFSKKPIYSLTRASIFGGAFNWFLDALNMIPIYRLRDGYASLKKNDLVFEKSVALLKERKSMLIFPEAAHHKEYYLHSLTKGLVRIALKTQAEFDGAVYIQPVGINYFRHFFPRHKLVLKYGKPINVSLFLEGYKKHEAKSLNELRESLSKSIKECLVIPNRTDHYNDQKEVFARVNEKLSFLELRAFAERHIIEKEQQVAGLKWIANVLMIINLPFFTITSYVLKNKVKEVEFYGSLKFVFGLFLFPLCLLISFLLGKFYLGLTFALIIVLIQFIALFLRQHLLRFTH